MEERPKIPPAIKRAVRIRCGFGCVLCGSPFLLEYDHIIEWNVVKEHTQDNITLLCRHHHGEKTNGFLPIGDLIRADKEPYNIVNGISAAFPIRYSGEQFSVIIGTNILEIVEPNQRVMDALVINQFPIVSFYIENGMPFLNINICNQDNQIVLSVKDNEVEFNLNAWDIEAIANRIIVREAPNNILVEIEFLPPDKVNIIRGKFGYQGIVLRVTEDQIKTPNGIIMRGATGRGKIGLAIGTPPNDATGIYIP